MNKDRHIISELNSFFAESNFIAFTEFKVVTDRYFKVKEVDVETYGSRFMVNLASIQGTNDDSVKNMIEFIQKELSSPEVRVVIEAYLKKTGYPKKWVLLTDYCLDDKNKANVITFVLLFFRTEEEHAAMEQKILTLQKSDIKHTRYISNRLMRYLRKLPVFSYSFILEDRLQLFGDTTADQQREVVSNLTVIRDCYQTWLKTAPNQDVVSYYQDNIKKLDAQIKVVSQGKKIRQHVDILLTTALGAVYTAEILKNVPDLQIVGWLPDRDKITQSCNEIAIPIFHCMLYNSLGGKDVQLPVADPKITGKPFYDAMNRVPDDICAAVADYDFSHPTISKEKFSHVLHVLMAGNPYVRVHRLSKDATSYHFSTLYYKTNLWMSIKFYYQTACREVNGVLKRVKSLCKR
jgi:hypothetical protein